MPRSNVEDAKKRELEIGESEREELGGEARTENGAFGP